jgi:hypothetical protein
MNKNKIIVFFVGFIITTVIIFFVNEINVVNKKTIPHSEEESFGSVDDPMGRIEYENRMLQDPATGRIPDNIHQKELAFAKTLPVKAEGSSLAKGNNVNSLTWSQRGPINRGGRTRALGVDVRTNTGSITIIAGGVSGGIWKSTDDGATWVNKLSPSLIHSVTCIVQDTRSGHEDTWYAGTGEFYGTAGGGGGATFRGDGIFISNDNGESWSLLPNTSNGQVQAFNNSYFRYISNIAVNPTSGSVFADANGTLQRSTNGGTDWTEVRGTNSISSTPSGVQITSTGVIYAAIPYNLGNPGVWRSTDDGANWAEITPSSYPSIYLRTVIAVDPNNENVVYFWTYTTSGLSNTSLWKYTYVSGDGSGAGGTWVDLTSKLPTSIGGQVGNLNVQGSYDMVMKVQPGNSNFVVIGGTNLYRTTDGFATQIGSSGWIGGYSTANDVTQYANHHPDQHSLVFLTGVNSKILYSGHDGGISRTYDVTASTVTWANLNQGYVTSQFYSLAIDPTTANDNHIIGGMQDNGNYFTSSSSFNNNWTELPLGGDGGYTEITSGHTQYYFETQYGGVYRFQLNPTTGNYSGLPWTEVKPAYQTSYLFVCPFVLDPNNNSMMYMAAGDSVWRNSNTLGIANYSQSTTYTNWDSLTHSSTGGVVTALGISTTPANRLYVGGSNGKILRIDNANTGDPTSTDLTSALITAGASSGAYINCIAVDPADADKVFVVFSNYSVPSLFVTQDGGTTWQNVSGNLEQNSDGSGNGPSCRWVGYYDDGANGTFYVATSTGLYSTNNLNGSSTVWTQEGSSTIGNVVCPMVRTRQSDGLVVVATHGAGIYSANQTAVGVESETSNIPVSYALNQNYPNPFNPSTKINFTLPTQNNVKLTVYDITGKEVKELINGELSAGDHTVDFNAANLASGAYIYRIQAGNFVESKKMVLLK